MKNAEFIVKESGIKTFGRTWDRIESYELDSNDWFLLSTIDDSGYEFRFYENNDWGGLIMFTDWGDIFVSYI